MKNITAQAYAEGRPWHIAVIHYAIIAIFCLFFILAIPTNAVGVNLIQNPSFEQADPSNDQSPIGWSKDKWGNNKAVFTYPIEGQDGNRAAKVQITSYKSGDEKWWFNHVPVSPGTIYHFSDYYQSDVATELVIEYKKTNNTFSYISLGNVPSSANWVAISKTFKVPAWVQSATVYHLIESVWSLTIDNVSLSPTNDDPVSPPLSETENLISNASVETTSASTSIPLDWNADFWGKNKAVFTYPIAGQSGNKWVRVQLTSYKSGDAKWYFKHVPVTPGKTYAFSDYYQSDVPTTVTLEYKTSAGKLSYDDLGTLPAAADWTRYVHTFTPPVGVTAVSVLHHIDKIGYLNTDNFSLLVPSTETGSTPPTDTGSTDGSGTTSGSGTGSTAGTGTTNSGTTATDTGTTTWTGDTNGSGSTTDTGTTVGTGTTGTGTSTGSGGSNTGTVTWTGSSDTFPPDIFLISPTGSGTTLSGTFTLSATWSDSVGIVGVQFLLDGTPIGTEALSSPYSLNWNTTTISDGIHQISARARDASGNMTTSAPVSVRISNTVTPLSDTISPVVTLTSPTGSGTLSGAIRLAADATDNIGVSGVTFYVDNIAVGSGKTNTGSANSYDMLLDSATLTNGVHSLYAKASDAAGNSGSTTTVSVTINNSPSDTEAPKVSITSPANGSTVSGTSTLNISTTDNIGVTAVHYSITNGTDVIVGQLTTAPYVVTIPADALKSGSHTVTVYAQDAAGNIGNAAPVIYNTLYTPPTTLSPNLILNPSLETGTGGIPDYWAKGGWGTNTATFTYPVPGVDGLSAAEISMSAWTSGDAKWFFADVPVFSWATYTFSDKYKSTTFSTLTAQYTKSDGTVSFADIVSNLPASADWITATQTIVIPADTVKLTVFHLINSIGKLDIDNAELRLSSSSGTTSGTTGSGETATGTFDANAFPTGLVSLTFDDGWGSQYDSALPMLNAAGIKGSFYIITDELKNAVNENRIVNPSFEVADSPSTPSGWTGSKSGTNNAVFTYPASWVSGGKAAKVEITSYTSGDAKWQFDDTTVVDGEIHNFTDQYMATVPTKVTVVYTLNNNTTQTFDLGTVPASSTWSVASFTFTPPTNTKSLTIYHRLTSAGMLTTDDYHLDLAQDYMNVSQLKDIYNAGHELSAHTRSHPFLTQITAAQATAEISGSRQDMVNAGFTPSDTFVYPYGDYNPSVIQITKDAGYIGARSVDQGYNTKATNKYALMIQEVNSNTTAQQWESWTQTAIKNHTWLILMFHQIDHQVDQYGATPEDLQAYVNYLKANNVPTITMEQGIKMMNP